MYAIVLGGSWWAALTYGWAALTGGVDPAGERSRPAAGAFALLTLLVAAAMSWLAWMYLRRPIINSPLRPHQRDSTIETDRA